MSDTTSTVVITILIILIGFLLWDMKNANQTIEGAKIEYIKNTHDGMNGSEKVALIEKICEKHFPEISDWVGNKNQCTRELVKITKV